MTTMYAPTYAPPGGVKSFRKLRDALNGHVQVEFSPGCVACMKVGRDIFYRKDEAIKHAVLWRESKVANLEQQLAETRAMDFGGSP